MTSEEPDYTETADRAWEESKDFRPVFISREERDNIEELLSHDGFLGHRLGFLIRRWNGAQDQSVWTPEVLEDFKRMFDA